jgi:hypothetical protein
MTIVEITDGMLRAARRLTGLTQQELADHALDLTPGLTAWEGQALVSPITASMEIWVKRIRKP